MPADAEHVPSPGNRVGTRVAPVACTFLLLLYTPQRACTMCNTCQPPMYLPGAWSLVEGMRQHPGERALRCQVAAAGRALAERTCACPRRSSLRSNPPTLQNQSGCHPTRPHEMLAAGRQVAAAAEAWSAVAARSLASGRSGKTGRPRPAPARAPPPPAATDTAAGQPPAEQHQAPADQLMAQPDEWTEVMHSGSG